MRVLEIIALLALGGAVAAQDAKPEGALRFGLPFGDHMVLQRGRPIVIFGEAGRRLPVTVTFARAERLTVAGPDGKWTVNFPALAASRTPRSIVVTSLTESAAVRDVLIGDVWFCAGQSNMRFALKSAKGGKAAIAAAENPLVRFVDFHGRVYPSRKKYPIELLRSIRADNYYTSRGWQRCGPETVGGFSAVAYFFGASVARRLGVPIGLIHNAVGGVPTESYIPRTAMAADAKLRGLLRAWHDNPDYPAWCRQRGAFNLSAWSATKEGPAPHHPFEPGFLFEAAVRPFLQTAIKGVIWYQGESNATLDGSGGAPVDIAVNEHKLTRLIRSWRSEWRRPALPFFYVQLPGLTREWAPFRESQRRVAQKLPHTDYVVTLDVGHPTNVHPTDKRPVGERLARLAVHLDDPTTVAKGPEYAACERQGRQLMLRFKPTSSGLRTADGKAPRCFAVAGDDRVFHPAVAGFRGSKVIVSSPEVEAPVAARYAWQNDPPVNFVNGEGLPAAPFRTDDWPLRKKIRVACIGDSITFGHGIANRRRANYPAQLEQILGPDYGVREFGNSGRGILERSMRGETKRAFVFQREHTAALAYGPDIVICNLGINDIMDWKQAGRLEFVRDYRKLIQAYKRLPSKPRIILWSPLTPLFDGHRFFRDPRIPAINAAIVAVAKLEKVETMDAHTALKGAGADFPDHVHPNATAARRIAQLAAAAIR